MPLTPERLREVLSYDAETGIFTWKKRISIRIVVGRVAGVPDKDGYIQIGIDGGKYKAHRLAWVYVTGGWPDGDIDHRNRVVDDNRFINLRPASRTLNNANMKKPKHNTSGLKGAYWNKKEKRWQAYIQVDKKHKYLGGYSTKEEAHAAYIVAANDSFGAYARAA